MSGIIVIGGGIAGLSLALGLKQRGIACRVYESAPEVRELGVGITLLPHAMREFITLGLEDRLRAVAIENEESIFFNRHGQFIYREPRGRFAGYPFPELGIHRGKLHRILYEEARERLGADSVLIDHHCTGIEQDENGVTEALTAFENRLIAEQETVAATANALFKARRDDLALIYLTNYSRQSGEEGLRLGNALLASIEARTRVIGGLRTPKTDEMSELSYDRVDCLP